MTPTDKVRFVQCFNRLAVACRLPAAEADASMQRIYFEGLQDLPMESIEQSAGDLEKSAEWFPKVSEWRKSAKVHKSNLRLVLPPMRETDWKDECDICLDSGWARRVCYPGTAITCGRPNCERERPEHFYVVRCACVPTNRTYQRHHVYNTYEQPR